MVLLFAGMSMATGSNTLTVSANVMGTCKFSSASSTLGFGGLDPTVGTNVSATSTTQFWCTKGVTLDAITADNGAHFAASRNMQDPVSLDLIPYTLSLTKDANPNTGPLAPRTLTISGTVLGIDYTSKTAGNYSDTVVLTITP